MLPDKTICFEVVLVIYCVVGVKRSTPGWQQDEEDTVRSGVEDTFVWGSDVRTDCLRAAVGLAVISAISDLKQEGQQGPEQQTHQATDTK